MRVSTSLVVAAVAAVMVACGPAASAPGGSGSGGSGSGSGGSGSGGSGASPTAPVATAAASGRFPTFTGSAKVTLDVAGTVHTLEGGRCDLQELPADFGGGWAFGINIGTPSTDQSGPDYFGLVVDVPGADPDGTYADVLATATVGGSGFNIGSVELTIQDDGRRGEFTGQSHGIGPVQGVFEC
jgi:hypothetical protein